VKGLSFYSPQEYADLFRDRPNTHVAVVPDEFQLRDFEGKPGPMLKPVLTTPRETTGLKISKVCSIR